MRKDLIEDTERAVALAAHRPWTVQATEDGAAIVDARGSVFAHVKGTADSEAHHNAQAIAAAVNALLEVDVGDALRRLEGLQERVGDLESDLLKAERARDRAKEEATELEAEVKRLKARVAELERSPEAA